VVVVARAMTVTTSGRRRESVITTTAKKFCGRRSSFARQEVGGRAVLRKLPAQLRNRLG
jgi:hypothetical protein